MQKTGILPPENRKIACITITYSNKVILTVKNQLLYTYTKTFSIGQHWRLWILPYQTAMLVLVKNPAISPKIALLTFSQRCRHFHDQSYMRKIHIIPKDSDLALNFAYRGGFIVLKQRLMQKTGILPPENRKIACITITYSNKVILTVKNQLLYAYTKTFSIGQHWRLWILHKSSHFHLVVVSIITCCWTQ